MGLTIFKIIVLAFFIMISVYLAIDFAMIYFAIKNAKENHMKYSKVLSTEVVALFIWSILLSILIIV